MAEEAKPVSSAIRMAAINTMIESIRYKGQLIARANKYESGIMDSGMVGFAIGFLFAVLIIVLPVLVVG